ncbi:MAG: hypothetical protein IJ996_05450 [Clostridia bacterium]|nr:hypothetical protein [Clostridia bacterium]
MGRDKRRDLRLDYVKENAGIFRARCHSFYLTFYARNTPQNNQRCLRGYGAEDAI